jgi:hypothetical protein
VDVASYQVALRWIARAWSAPLILVWGNIFVEHLTRVDPNGFAVPLSLAMLQGLVLLLLIGLAAGWRWELAGGIITCVSVTLFFGLWGGPHPLIFANLTIAPGVVWLALGLETRRKKVLGAVR